MSRSFAERALTLALCVGVAGAVTARVAAQAPKEPKTVILAGSPALGGIKFEHQLHTKDRGAKCETCHHPSKPEKPLKEKQQKCSDCHTKTAAAPMKTKLQAAFHDPMAKKGVCVDCHSAAVAKGKKAPVKCNDCHKKENKA